MVNLVFELLRLQAYVTASNPLFNDPTNTFSVESDVSQARSHMNLSRWEEYSIEEKEDLLRALGLLFGASRCHRPDTHSFIQTRRSPKWSGSRSINGHMLNDAA